MNQVMVIAEAGVNHNGDLRLAYRLVDAAKAAGADFVKFQTYKTEELIRRGAELAAYQKQGGGHASQFDLLKSLELPFADFEKLFAYAREQGLAIFSTAFDLESLHFLQGLGQRVFKMSSGDMDNLPLIRAVVAGKPELVIMSTGAAQWSEVEASVALFRAEGLPSERLAVLHCTTQYPAPLEDVNMRAMPEIGRRLGVQFGYSDHSLGTLTPVVAVALGARIIEKHMTLDKGLPGPDHRASLDPGDFRAMVGLIRDAEKMLGHAEKGVAPSEASNRRLVRKSIVARVPIKKGDELSAERLTTKRPQDGLSPMRWDEVVGTKAIRDFAADESIEIHE